MTQQPAPAYSPGLEGVIAGESAICQVNPNAGLSYRGYDVHELAEQASFEQVAYLLLHGELPEELELRTFESALSAAATAPKPVTAMLRLLPAEAHPIDALRTAVSMLAMFAPAENDHSHDANVQKAVGLIAKTSMLTASAWRISHGQEPVEPAGGLSFAGRFAMGLSGKEPEDWRTRALNTIFILYAEHDFNASTFAARVTASTLSDMYAAVTSALGTLKGPLHGGANEEAMNVLREIGSPDQADAWVAERLVRHEKISGFGHRVYRTGDSRVPVMRALARDLAGQVGQEQMVAVCEELESVMAERKGLYANVDLYAAPVLAMLGVAPELNTPIFACARMAGWCAHVIEQHDHNRLIRPRSLYTGAGPRRLAPR